MVQLLFGVPFVAQALYMQGLPHRDLLTQLPDVRLTSTDPDNSLISVE